MTAPEIHEITETDDGATCSCGQVFARPNRTMARLNASRHAAKRPERLRTPEPPEVPQRRTAARDKARVELVRRHRSEYRQLYRKYLLQLGGTPLQPKAKPARRWSTGRQLAELHKKYPQLADMVLEDAPASAEPTFLEVMGAAAMLSDDDAPEIVMDDPDPMAKPRRTA